MDPRTVRMLAEHEQAAASAPPPPTGAARIGREIAAWIRAHKRAAAGLAIVLSGAMFLAYYELVSVPAQAREKAEIETRAVAQLKVENAARQVSLDTCLSTAKAQADARWNNQCRVRRRSAGCALPPAVADRLELEEGRARNVCLIQHSVAAQ